MALLTPRAWVVRVDWPTSASCGERSGSRVAQRSGAVGGPVWPPDSGAGHIQPQVLLGIELSSAANQHRCQVAPDVPVAPLVGIGKRGAMHCLAKSHPIKLGRVRPKCGLDIAQRLSPSDLCVGHDAKVFGARQHHGAGVARVARHDAREARPGHTARHT